MVMAARRRRIAARPGGAAPQHREAERIQTVPTVLCQPLPRLHGAAGERWRARQDGGIVRKAQHTVVVPCGRTRVTMAAAEILVAWVLCVAPIANSHHSVSYVYPQTEAHTLDPVNAADGQRMPI